MRHYELQKKILPLNANMKWYFTFLSIVGLLLSLSSCWEKNVSFSTASSDTIPMRYAQNIVIVRDSLFYQVDLTDPWHEGRILHSYILIDSANAPKTTDLPVSHGTTVIQTPLRHSVVFNTAHAFLLQMLGATDAIEGVADARYMQIPEIHRRIRQGKVADCGDSMAPDLEKIINIKADAVWLSPFEDSGGYGRIGEIGIPVIECADYMETSALGRAEWMRFYGLLVGKENEADSLFDIVEHSYLELASQAQAAGNGRSIITERLTGSTWYVPGGRSSKGRLIADANGQYAWSSDNHSGSLALSYETVLRCVGIQLHRSGAVYLQPVRIRISRLHKDEVFL